MSEQWTKADLINWIAKLYGYRSYLEICTANTGFRYREIDRNIFTDCQRIMYRCPSGYSDGMPIDFRCGELEIGECLRLLRARRRRYDVVLVDPWHEYGTSLRDLRGALSLIAEDGTLVVHDCLPHQEEIAQPTCRDGDWTGVTYTAFLDFVLTHSAVDYQTVDIDYGCGIIRVRKPSDVVAPSTERAALERRWAAIGDDYSAAFRFMRDHTDLWNPIELAAFLREETARAASRANIWKRAHSAMRDRVASFFARRPG